jgi:acetolactate synthase-1/2/3 large subunit
MDSDALTGAEAIVGTLAACGVTACFANPGTSEMHLVTALDREPRIRSVLCLFEGVATGAADGFARVSGRPAVTLLHLGPGYLNGGANIHNARRAFTPMINLIGDHALGHRVLDAPLASDIVSLAAPNSRWLKSADRLDEAGDLAAEAYAESFGPAPGPVSLILPADVAWTRGARVGAPLVPAGLRRVEEETIALAAAAVRTAARPVVLVNGSVLLEAGLPALARLQQAGVRVVCDTFVGRQSRGEGRFAPSRLPYFAEAAIEDLAGVDLLLVCGTKPPVAFFAYPDTPGVLSPEGAKVFDLGGPDVDSADALGRLAGAIGATEMAASPTRSPIPAPTGKLNAHSIGASIARHLPDNSVISDDGVTAGLPVYLATSAAARHDWLAQTGGAIGQGMPVAIGAAIARPENKVVCLSGDGAGMYTVQSLWTMAREGLDIVTVVVVNHAYRILRIELARTGAGAPGPAASGMLSLDAPEIDWVALARGMGVPAEMVSTAEAFDEAFRKAMDVRGPRLIAALVPA